MRPAPPANPMILGYLAVYKLTGHHLMLQHGPLMAAGALLLLAGLLMFSTGLLSEILIRTYFESQGRRIYALRDVLSSDDRVPVGVADLMQSRETASKQKAASDTLVL
jgi:hypothetical protein